MAISIDSTTNLHVIDSAESTTGWTFSGITKTATSSASREGTNCIGGQVGVNSYGYAWHTHGSSINMTTAGNERVYIWVNSVGPGTYAQNGWMVVIGDGTNRRAYRVGGSDVVPFSVKGWYCLMLDTANLPTTYQTIAGASQPSLTAITQFGFGIYNVVAPSGNALNVFCDVVRYGSGLVVTSGASDEITLADIADNDFSSVTGSAWGIVREIQPGVYGVQGDILFGNTSGGSIDWKESDSVVIFEDRVEGTGSNTKFQLSGQHSATGTFSVELGVVVSSGDDESGRSGVTFISANPVYQPVDFDFSDSDIEDVFLYGCTLTNIRGGTVAFSADATNGISHHISGTSFSGCSKVSVGVTDVRNCLFASTSDVDAALVWNESIDIKNCNFIGNTIGAAIEMPSSAGTPYSYDNLKFTGNTNDVYNSSGTAISINKNNGSNPTSSEGSSVTFLGAAVTTEVTVKDLSTGSEIEDARVLVWATGSENKFYQDTVSISASGSTATVTHTAHNLSTGDNVIIYGVTEDDDYNGVYEVTVTGANSYTYDVIEALDSGPYTGSVNWAIVTGSTNASGYISDTRTFDVAQPVTGWVRKANSSPYYQQGAITGTISDTTGLSLTIQLNRDE